MGDYQREARPRCDGGRRGKLPQRCSIEAPAASCSRAPPAQGASAHGLCVPGEQGRARPWEAAEARRCDEDRARGARVGLGLHSLPVVTVMVFWLHPETTELETRVKTTGGKIAKP